MRGRGVPRVRFGLNPRKVVPNITGINVRWTRWARIGSLPDPHPAKSRVVVADSSGLYAEADKVPPPIQTVLGSILVLA